jgi:hypothetical protein
MYGEGRKNDISRCSPFESRLEGVNRQNLKFINFKHVLRPGLALELNRSVEDCFPCNELLKLMCITLGANSNQY